MRLNRALLFFPAVPVGAALALTWLLVLPGTAGAASSEASDPSRPASAAVAVPATGAASAPRWRAPGLPAEDDWSDLDAAAAQAEALAQQAPARPARPALPASAPRPKGTGPAEEPSAAKAMAKSAWGWLKELAPWAFSSDNGDGDEHAAPREIVVTGDMLLGTPQEVMAPAAGHRVGGAPPPPPPPATGMGPGGVPPEVRHGAWGLGADPLQEAIALVREVARHPMTWLLIVLAVLGRLVIWLLARPARRARVQRRRHRRHHR